MIDCKIKQTRSYTANGFCADLPYFLMYANCSEASFLDSALLTTPLPHALFVEVVVGAAVGTCK